MAAVRVLAGPVRPRRLAQQGQPDEDDQHAADHAQPRVDPGRHERGAGADQQAQRQHARRVRRRHGGARRSRRHAAHPRGGRTGRTPSPSCRDRVRPRAPRRGRAQPSTATSPSSGLPSVRASRPSNASVSRSAPRVSDCAGASVDVVAGDQPRRRRGAPRAAPARSSSGLAEQVLRVRREAGAAGCAVGASERDERRAVAAGGHLAPAHLVVGRAVDEPDRRGCGAPTDRGAQRRTRAAASADRPARAAVRALDVRTASGSRVAAATVSRSDAGGVRHWRRPPTTTARRGTASRRRRCRSPGARCAVGISARSSDVVDGHGVGRRRRRRCSG